MRSIRTILTVISFGFQSNRRFSGSAARTSNPFARTIQPGLSSSAVSSRSISLTMSSSLLGLDGTNVNSSLPNIRVFKAEDVSFINSSVAKAIDDDLMFNDGRFSVASAVHDFYTTSNFNSNKDQKARKILIISGPGNNGGDGLVSARHLKHFGYAPMVVYPKRSTGKHFLNLVRQCEDLGIELLDGAHFVVDSESGTDKGKEKNKEAHEAFLNQFDLIVDSIFGFSFEGVPRDPFKTIIAALARTKTPVISVDVPSGWHVEDGDIHKSGLSPVAVISLTAPKMCMKGYNGVHYIGGRFVPPAIAEKYKLSIPDYGFGTNQIVVSVPNTKNAQITAKSSVLSSNEKESLSVIYVSASSVDEAKTIAKGLLEHDLVACVSLIPQVTSMYMWEGKMEDSSEVIMMIKTRTSMIPAVSAYVKTAHSYTLPEVLALPVSGGSDEYLDWVRSSATGKGGAEK